MHKEIIKNLDFKQMRTIFNLAYQLSRKSKKLAEKPHSPAGISTDGFIFDYLFFYFSLSL